MFRLVFLTFHGERRHDAPAPAHADDNDHGHGGHDAHDHGHAKDHGHGHGGHHAVPHEVPWAMAAVLILLAVGSAAAGYIGVPHALGGHNALHAWLEPVFEAPVAEGATAEGPTAEAEGAAAEGEAAVSEEAHAEEQLELTLMGVSSGIAFLGIGIAAFIWIKSRSIADGAARGLAPIYNLLLNKYYVDEIYDATVVQPIKVISQEGLWRGFDVKVIDGVVNGTASVVAALAAALRRLQTGSVRAYAGSLFVGVVVVLGYYLWR
jgi:NADH-quinone oxidoreductase subunit L